MALEEILSVSGKPGLYRLVGQMKNGIIVEGIADGKRFPVHGSAKVSALEEISIYTDEEEVPLKDIFKNIFEKQGGKAGPDHKGDQKEVKKFFETILPNYDKERVYISDMAKVVKWYNILIENNAYDPKEAEEEKKEAETEESESKEAKPKKSTAKKAAAKPATKKAAPKAAAKAKSAGGAAPRKAGGSQRGS
jgi:hypothetical protein